MDAFKIAIPCLILKRHLNDPYWPACYPVELAKFLNRKSILEMPKTEATLVFVSKDKEFTYRRAQYI